MANTGVRLIQGYGWYGSRYIHAHIYIYMGRAIGGGGGGDDGNNDRLLALETCIRNNPLCVSCLDVPLIWILRSSPQSVCCAVSHVLRP